MDFCDIQENLRRLLWQRMRSGELTGLELAHQTGFRQAHISNFLNSKRGLSLEGLNKVLAAQHLSIFDLLDSEEVSRRASIVPPTRDRFENVPLVDGCDAFYPRFARDRVRDMFKVRKSLLRSLRTDMQGNRSSWQRFAFVRVSAGDGLSMYPRLLPGAFVLLDRHYNSLAAYRGTERNLYAVALQDRCTVRYAEAEPSHLILRPENAAYPVQLLPVAAGTAPGDYLIGRVCQILIDT